MIGDDPEGPLAFGNMAAARELYLGVLAHFRTVAPGNLEPPSPDPSMLRRAEAAGLFHAETARVITAALYRAQEERSEEEEAVVIAALVQEHQRLLDAADLIVGRQSESGPATLVAVSFQNVPLPAVAALLERLSAAGWEWQENRKDWTAVLRKTFEDAKRAHRATEEIRALMGDYFIDDRGPG